MTHKEHQRQTQQYQLYRFPKLKMHITKANYEKGMIGNTVVFFSLPQWKSQQLLIFIPW